MYIYIFRTVYLNFLFVLLDQLGNWAIVTFENNTIILIMNTHTLLLSHTHINYNCWVNKEMIIWISVIKFFIWFIIKCFKWCNVKEIKIFSKSNKINQPPKSRFYFSGWTCGFFKKPKIIYKLEEIIKILKILFFLSIVDEDLDNEETGGTLLN